MVHPLEQWFLWFVLYSFIGWIYESILCSVAGKKLVNRGFLNGPVCPSASKPIAWDRLRNRVILVMSFVNLWC